MGILLALITHIFPALQFLTTFELSQETLLYVFLPVLLFESAYNIKFRELIQHTRAITLLAVVALILSAMITAGILFYTLGSIGIAVPFLVLFLFGTLISATDPVSVLALFKEMGAPKRLTLIFEGESLFNDGTALALFFVILSLLLPHGHTHESFFVQLVSHLAPFLGSTFPVFSGIVSFLCMIGMGFLLGGLIGYTAAKSVPYIRKSKLLEVMLTVILAHATFLFAEWMHHTFFPVSAVIATTIAALVMGNYGHYKLSYQTRHMMHEYWEFFAFIVNSLVFLLVGVMMMRLNIHVSELILPMAIAIIAVAVGRAISVYSVLIPLNQTKKEYPIPTTWMHLLSWGSLRGGLAIIIALFIPEDFTLP